MQDSLRYTVRHVPQLHNLGKPSTHTLVKISGSHHEYKDCPNDRGSKPL